MSKSINISEKAYQWLLQKSSEETIKKNKNISIADIIDKLIKNT